MTATLGTIGVLLSLGCWFAFVRGAFGIVRTILIGQSVPSSRFFPVLPRLWTMIKEFIAHTRMIKFRTVGIAHWLVMIGFLCGMLLFFEAYGQAINPEFHWPIIGDTFGWHLWDEILGIGTVVGIVTLIVIRQLNHPRIPERISRFSGSRFVPAYTIEAIVLVEGLGMVFVKAGKIATYHHHNAGSDFFTMQVAKLLPASPNMVGIFALIKLLSGSLFLLLVGTHLNWGVAWHRFSAFFNIYFKREQDGGVALGAAKPMMSQGKVLDPETADPDVDAFGAGRVEDFSWKAWLDFTTCTECGRCQSQCPAWNTGKPLSPKLLIMSLRDHGMAKAPYLLAGGSTDMGGEEVGLLDADGKPDEEKLNAIPAAARAEAARKLVGESKGATGGGEPVVAEDGAFDPEALGAVIDTETLWSCTTCGACVEQCPVDIEHVDHILDMRRYQVLIESDFPTELAGMFKKLETKGNPWGQNAAARTAWIDEMDIDIPVFGQDVESFEGFEYLFWVGCAGAYEDRAKKTTKAVAELLDMAAVNFLVLGQGETCTGDSARRAGNEFLFQMLAQQNIEMMNQVFDTAPGQRKKIVVTCAHCFNALGNEYPQVGGTYEVVHHTQLLNRLVREKRLVPVAPIGEGVTYHDPCYLGRHNKVYDAPRELMAASGSTLTEMPRHGERSMCCGAGGARMWMEEQIGKRINVDRVDEALGVLETAPQEVKKVATGCPFCRVMLTDGVTARTAGTELEDKIEVVDVAQMLLESVKRGDPVEVKRGGKFLHPSAPAPEPEPEPEPEPVKVIEKAAPAAASGGAAKPKVGLGMKGGMKKPGGAKAAAPAAEAAPATEAKPAAKGFGMKGGMKKPGGAKPAATAAPAAEAPEAEKKPAAKGFGMKGGIKKPGAAKPAAAAPEAAPATEAPAAEKKPAAKGFGMKSGIKKPGAAKPAAASAPAAEAPAVETPAVETPAVEAPAAAATTDAGTAKAKGFGMAAGKKRPGAKPVAKPAVAEPAGDVEEIAETEAAVEAAAPAVTETIAPAVTEAGAAKAKGFGMAAGKKRPGAKAAPDAKPAPVPAPEPETAEPELPEAEPAEPEVVEAEEPAAQSPDGDARTIAETGAAKAKGFGMAAGKKRPGHH
ncbi:4Fe-4S dicluster domain-containing protein [Gordonia amarae]|uniref:4Fe-4S dicluster domain-containing protein n=2 Tax=Gordonia amarae TaxID=36821 RepID=A0A857MJ05_9ACTN|nr:heterodisulfide reductase-related iron-sulfur binding cluster [Gordonia amarae]MCS3880822.1 Fe-S oxidoreductase [Gordonia amarae]QHN19097.1 4Fe-4S dicluster domain-containing protein [Gordonia amarae]QHN23573.1 4Fe-4S dicluster domain-containing protein [Gordonia amarae]QHN32473.1 4Fe-4S dicluster domain-containing protein [Gordonia amarae]QHN41221.1 4Fe-4S dicluster domain-containing protein [Gordonia amarae]